ncbi:hypothetical protein IHV09_09975 [Fictibacillus sp. 23RED33]|uniref:hypothetical protein n=1 Tax=Fictibacillus sp. 23RED33 TaxID=2745879 RepID=UPI0018CDEBDA|nr:hypothetical protein [Fictibacillus sp. 23RED33]MBH0173888.1 hypothetical protein [Fictibacillus sp. 23RED33]
MVNLKMYISTIIEILVFLLIGFFLTENVLRNVYENVGIAYLGNVGIVWFGLSFFLFCIFTLICYSFLGKKSPMLKDRITSLTFWIVFVASAYAVFIPFAKGEI